MTLHSTASRKAQRHDHLKNQVAKRSRTLAKTEEKAAPNKDVSRQDRARCCPEPGQAAIMSNSNLLFPLQPPPGAKIAVPPKEQPKNFQIGSILEPALWLIAILTVGAILMAWLKKNRDRTSRCVGSFCARSAHRFS